MKKLLITLAACLMLAGCSGVSQSDYDAAIQERDALATQVAELQTASDTLTAENESLKAENQTLTASADASATTDTAAADTSASEDYAYIGNINSYKFHLPTCEYLPYEGNRVYYQTREDAINDGMVPCKVCCP